jgi:hypothetical protein
MMDLFAGRDGVHGTHGEPDISANGLKWEIKRTARTLREPVTLELWEQHLRGTRPLGVVPIRDDNSCGWGSIDVDQYDADMLEIVRRVEAARLPLVPCRSKSGGLHLFLFLSEGQPAELVQRILGDIAARLGLAGSEIFPKQTNVLAERGNLGNWMVMPYFGSTFNGRLRDQVGLKKTGAEQTVTEFLDMAERSRLSRSQLEELARARVASNSEGEFRDGPCCLQHMSRSGFPEGGRNNALFMMGVYLKRKHPVEWKEKVREHNQKYMRPPLTDEEVTGVTRSLEKKEYEYTCRNEPMAAHCDSATCRGRRFGVGEAASFPSILDLEKLKTDPPLWFVTIEEGKVVDMSTEELLDFPRFQRAVAAKMSRMFRHMTPAAWAQALAEPMSRVRETDVPDDLSEAEQFREQLEEFLTNRGRGDRREDLLLGRPWEDQEAGRHYFTLKELIKFLQREWKRDVRRSELKLRIEALGGEGGLGFNIQGKFKRVWWVPSDRIHAQTEDPPPRPVPQAPI